MSRRVGLDGWAIGVHAFVTIALAIALGEAAGPDDDIVVPIVFAASAIVFEWRRRQALRAAQPEGLTTGEVAATRLEEVEIRVAELEELHTRVAELEERLDFSERLLAAGEGRRVPADANWGNRLDRPVEGGRHGAE